MSEGQSLLAGIARRREGDGKKKEMEAYVEAAEWFLEHPDALKDSILKAYLEVIRERLAADDSAAAGSKAAAGTTG